MVNIIIYDNDGNELYRFRNVWLPDARAILEGAVDNDDAVLIEKAERPSELRSVTTME